MVLLLLVLFRDFWTSLLLFVTLYSVCFIYISILNIKSLFRYWSFDWEVFVFDLDVHVWAFINLFIVTQIIRLLTLFFFGMNLLCTSSLDRHIDCNKSNRLLRMVQLSIQLRVNVIEWLLFRNDMCGWTCN